MDKRQARIHAFKDQKSLEGWYRKHHDKADELWLKIAKKRSKGLSRC